MSLCLASAVLALSLGVDRFTLRWTHSVERSEWVEHWRVDGANLVLQDALVRGSGAGMEPPEGSVLHNGWWVYRADRRVPALLLAVSGATGRGWQLCTELGCEDLEVLMAMGRPLQAPIHLSTATRCRPVAD